MGILSLRYYFVFTVTFYKESNLNGTFFLTMFFEFLHSLRFALPLVSPKFNKMNLNFKLIRGNKISGYVQFSGPVFPLPLYPYPQGTISTQPRFNSYENENTPNLLQTKPSYSSPRSPIKPTQLLKNTSTSRRPASITQPPPGPFIKTAEPGEILRSHRQNSHGNSLGGGGVAAPLPGEDTRGSACSPSFNCCFTAAAAAEAAKAPPPIIRD